jgi:hypothetical protein
MDPFSEAVNTWHDFYLMVGTAAATLVGLLFVSLSLNVDAITLPINSDLRELAEQTFSTFLSILSFAILFLIPHQAPLGLGLPLFAVGGFGLIRTIRRILRSQPSHPRAWGQSNLIRRFIAPVIGYLALIVISITVMIGRTGGLYWLIPVMISLIVAASMNAWDLLLGLREPQQKSA